MELFAIIHSLETTGERIAAVARGLDAEQARWKPDPGSWSVLEVINHLYDEERFDFRVRIDYVLHRPGEEPPDIDPQGWVTERQYNTRELEPSLQNFLAERRRSLEWLRSLASPDWEKVYAASWGSIRAGDLLAAWAAHDLLHLRQLVELHWALLHRLTAPYQTAYAGDW